MGFSYKEIIVDLDKIYFGRMVRAKSLIKTEWEMKNQRQLV